ncbi:hypothetical protein [Neobacillus sp. PS2-9]|uniref:hypothetical protein n=1 Tax=Neobacillus sp. PS2-9 TaxID=3070676 RepID=UPI0027E03502|nr:hypothetical protein [Neobacillus sp. PS2-9]WML56486.1 hypothetical protein RCG25_16295 [Neobacillus sp. PS2-9]
MSKLSKRINEYFYAWGDNDPKKTVLRYGKDKTLEQLYGYEDYVHYRPRRQMAGRIIILGGLGLIGLSVKGAKVLKAKYDKRKTEKENL